VKRILVAFAALTLANLNVSHASGPVTITQIVHCSDYGGLQVYQLSDGNNVLIYDGTDQYSKNMQALMTAAWLSGKTIQSYSVGSAGSNCGLWAANITSVTIQ
jgi:hypothetical protein